MGFHHQSEADKTTTEGNIYSSARGDRDSGGVSPTRPPAKGAEMDPAAFGEGLRGGDLAPPPVLKGLTVTDVRREDAFFELFW